MDAFQMLSPFLQRKIWDMKWESFTPIQEKAIVAIMSMEKDVVLVAGTASGKTEAAFLPILTKVEKEANQHLKVLYISPLKALINNQFTRINKLCEYMQVAVHSWHGDIAHSKKKKFLKHPTGILQITPESIESLFINRPEELSHLWKEVAFIVIDEIHSFIDQERGVQLRSLLSRIEEYTERRPRLIGLSATIGNFALVKEWINPDQPDQVEVIEERGSDKRLLYHLMYFQADQMGQKPIELFEDIRELTREEKAILFCNDRGTVEETTVFLNRLSQKEGRGQCYYPHHSSINKREREYVEKIISETPQPKSVIATSSLELGIDIGDIDLVIQLDSTYSVSSLKQRLGRSGRKRNADQILQMYATNPDSLLQSIAVMELILDKWIEPAKGYPLPYDILFQQIISICAEKNGIRKEQLLEKISNNASFFSLNIMKVEKLIDFMIEKGILEVIGNKELIVGIEGERILRSKEFYSVFLTSEEYEVKYGIKPIGSISKTPFISKGDNIILAGRLWMIIDLDPNQNKILVQKSINGKPPIFLGSGGKIHGRIAQKMMDILCSETQFSYLDPHAENTLANLRKPYIQEQIHPTQRVIWKDRDQCRLDTFASSEVVTTLYWLMKLVGVSGIKRDSLGRMTFNYDQKLETLFKELTDPSLTEEMILTLKKKAEPFQTKYSRYLPVELHDEMHIAHELDLQGTREYLEKAEFRVIDLE